MHHTKLWRRWALIVAALALVTTAGVVAWGLDGHDDDPEVHSSGTLVMAEYRDLEIPVCSMTLSTSADGDQITISWLLESNRPGGTLELRTAPGNELVATVTLDAKGASSSSATTALPSVATWLTATITAGGERGGCASVQFV